MNTAIINRIDKKFYTRFPSNWDNKVFRRKILSVLKPGDSLLDLGAGSGYVKEMNFKNDAKEVTGIDLDTGVLANPFLHRAVHGSVYDLAGLDEKKFDVVICNSVMEHIDDPVRFVDALSRVLKPGGYFLGKTPNRNHYMPLVARITPLSFHKWYNRKRGRPEEHTFPTYYRMNTPRRVKALFRNRGFEDPDIEMIEGPPSYLRINFLLYAAGWLYERVVTALGLASLKMVMIFSVRKKK
jgi:SAM-dependent methyltransferase